MGTVEQSAASSGIHMKGLCEGYGLGSLGQYTFHATSIARRTTHDASHVSYETYRDPEGEHDSPGSRLCLKKW